MSGCFPNLKFQFYTVTVRTNVVQMKNITFSADEQILQEAREVARVGKTTLNQLFREWLAELVTRREREKKVAELLQRLRYADSGGVFPREVMNER